MNVGEHSQKSCGTQNKSVFWHVFMSYLRSGTTALHPLCHVSSPHIIRAPKVPPPERTTGVAQTCCWCEDMNAQKVSVSSRDRQLLSGGAGPGAQICLPSQHAWAFCFLLPTSDDGKRRGFLMGNRKMSSTPMDPCWTWSEKYQESSGFYTVDSGLKIFQNMCFVILFLIAK